MVVVETDCPLKAVDLVIFEFTTDKDVGLPHHFSDILGYGRPHNNPPSCRCRQRRSGEMGHGRIEKDNVTIPHASAFGRSNAAAARKREG